MKEKIRRAKVELKWKAQAAWNRTKGWCYMHEREIQKFLAVMITAIILIAKNLYRDFRKFKERRSSDCNHYDFQEHQWYETKKPLSNMDKVRIQQLRRQGYTLGEALRELKLLK